MAKLLSGTRIYGSATIDTTLSLGTSAIFAGSTSGTTTLLATATAGTTTLTLPAATDTLVGKATTDTLTNKTLNSPIVTGSLTAGGGVGTNGQVLTSTGSGVYWTTVSGGGGGSYTLPQATTSVLGGVKVDGTTITIDAATGIISSAGGGGSTAAGVVPYDFGYITETVMTMQDHGSIV
jgi:hypothetical protein